jgi:uncharacterized protein DUF2784
MLSYRTLGDLVVVFHAAYVAFVVFGFVAIVIGVAMRREWVRNFPFRVAHLAAILLVCVEAIVGMVCPLTSLEDFLRMKGGASPYSGDFIGYWAHRLIYFEAPAWVFTTAYLAFGAAVAAIFVLAPPRFRDGRLGGSRGKNLRPP